MQAGVASFEVGVGFPRLEQMPVSVLRCAKRGLPRDHVSLEKERNFLGSRFPS